MKRLFILGCGGFGREIACMLSDHPDFMKKWKVCGFLDKKGRLDEGILASYPVLGSYEGFEFQKDDLIVLAIADTAIKEKLYEQLKERVQFFTFTHPSSKVFDYSTIGTGSVICANCIVSANVKIGKFVTVNSGTQIGHDCQIGDFSSLMSHVDLGGGVCLGTHVFMGTQSMIIPYKTVADRVRIAAGSVVMRQVKSPALTLMGNPAKKFI